MSPTQLLFLAAIAVLVVTLVAVGLPLLRRLRSQESAGGAPPASADAGVQAMRELGERIETIVSQQQEQGETQRQRFAQQIDAVQHSVSEQRVLVDSLRSESRHESQRRDHEMDEIRSQIASIQQAVPALATSSMRALPETASQAPSMPAEPADLSWSDTSLDDIPASPVEVFGTVETFDTAAPVEAETPAETIAPDAFQPPPAEGDDAPAQVLNAAAVFADIDPFAIESFSSNDAVETEDTFATAAPEADAPITFTEAAVEIVASDEPMPLETPLAAAPAVFEEASADLEPQPDALDDVLFEEMSLDEMTFDDFSFETDETSFDLGLADSPAGPEANVSTDAFAPASFDATEPAAADPMPSDPSPFSISAPTEEAPVAFSVTEMPVQAEAAEATSAPFDSAPLSDDIFTETFFSDEAVASADPLSFEDTFVPTPIAPETAAPAALDAEDVFASWSPSPADEAAADPFTVEPTPEPPAAPTAQVDLSTFEDWGLDPEPTPAASTEWAPSPSPPPSFDMWTAAPNPAPAPDDAPSSDAPPTAWVARNEALQPTSPPQAVAPPLSFEDEPAYAEEPVFASASVPAEAQAEIAQPPVLAEVAPQPVLAASPVAPAAEPIDVTPTPAPAASDVPTERLTVLPSIDEDMERALHLAGVTSLDEMARWGRTEARRIATEVGVSEDTVLNHWVFEAQTALFERFTQQVGS